MEIKTIPPLQQEKYLNMSYSNKQWANEENIIKENKILVIKIREIVERLRK